MTVTLTSVYNFGDRVHIDGDRSIAAIVVGLRFHAHDYLCEVSWWRDGSLELAWVDQWRLESVGVKHAEKSHIR